VKLLDFGIAKLLGEEESEIPVTRLGERMITPAYAAPEQILGGGVTVATDVFALGIVLYELLTGALPFDRRATTPQEMASRVERESVERPSTVAGRTDGADGAGRERQRWARRLSGDLDTITMKALAHDPERRYPSAAALAEDIRRYLTSRPVEARPDSRGYRLRKFVTRHRLGVAASGVVAAAVIVALVVSLNQTAAARREARRAAAAQAYLTSLFEQIDPGRSTGSAPTVRDLLERGSKRLDKDLAQQPELRAEMDALLGQVFNQLGQSDQGEAHFRRALKTRLALFGPGDARTAKAKKGLAITLASQARYDEAEPLFKELLARAEAFGDKRELASMLMNYGRQKLLTGGYAASEALLKRAVALLGEAEKPDRRALAGALGNLGEAYWRQGHERAAIKVYERTLAIRTKDEGPRSGVLAGNLHSLSQLHQILDELDIAERYGREALALEEALFPPNHPSIGGTLDVLAHVAQKRGDRANARALYERSITIYERSKRPDQPDLAYTLHHFAKLMLEEGDTEKALRLHERALALRRKALGDRHPEVSESWHNLAVARGRLAPQDLNAALESLRAELNTLRSTLPADSSLLARNLFFLGDVLRLNGRPGEAAPYLNEAQAIWHKKPPSNPKDLGDGSSIADLESAIAATRAAQS